MGSKLWLNLLLWGLGDRLEKRNDYKTDLLMLLNLMTWYTVFLYSLSSAGPAFWLITVDLIPASWIGTQFIVGYLLVRGARRQVAGLTKPVKQTPKEVMKPPSGPLESEEP